MLTEEDIPLCPYCDQPIFAYEDTQVIQVGDVLGLVHTACRREALNDEEDEE